MKSSPALGEIDRERGALEARIMMARRERDRRFLIKFSGPSSRRFIFSRNRLTGGPGGQRAVIYGVSIPFIGAVSVYFGWQARQ